MTSRILSGLALAALVAACNPKAAENTSAAANASSNDTAAADHPSDPVASAEAAAPAAIAKGATIVSMTAEGAMTVLRKGDNGWTCMPNNPATPGPDPMCMDANAMKWAEAWIAHKPPPANNVGLIYMLAGGSDASNMDPWGKEPKDGKWVDTGPHVMVVGSDSLNAIYPSSENPDTTKPYVMFGGTPYAHVMMPVK